MAIFDLDKCALEWEVTITKVNLPTDALFIW